MARHAGAEFPVLADPTESTTRSYGVYNLLGDRVSAPAVFIVGKDGAILWQYVGKHIGDRPSTREVLGRVSDLVG